MASAGTTSFLTPPPAALLNGRPLREPVMMRAGAAHRLRLINIRTDYLMSVALSDSGGTLTTTWTCRPTLPQT